MGEFDQWAMIVLGTGVVFFLFCLAEVLYKGVKAWQEKQQIELEHSREQCKRDHPTSTGSRGPG